MPLYVASIDLSKAFDLVSRDGLFDLLLKIGSPKLLSVIRSVYILILRQRYSSMAAYLNPSPFIVESNRVSSPPTLFWILFSMLLKHLLASSTERVYLHTRSDGTLRLSFEAYRLQAKRKVRRITTREILFADNAAVVANSEKDLKALMNGYAIACEDFELPISKEKT